MSKSVQLVADVEAGYLCLGKGQRGKREKGVVLNGSSMV